MSARDIVGGLAGAAVGAVKHPVGTAGETISKARTAVGAGTAVGTAVAGTVYRRVRGDVGEAKEKAAGAAKEAAGTAMEAAGTAKDATARAEQSEGEADRSTPEAPAKPARKRAGKKAAAKREPQVVLAEPTMPQEPPIDVVGQALAAEEEDDHIGAGRSTEPRGASRDEEHGDAALQRAEVQEIAEEMAEVARAGNLDLETPVGTTGADTGYNPDTAEADLQQPGTEPLVDPSLTNEVKSEQETLSNAAAPKKPQPKKSS